MGAQPQVLQCKGPLMVPMGCRAAADGKQRLHRCLARIVDYSVPEDGGLTSTSVHPGRAPGEGLGQCLLLNHMPSLRSKLGKSRCCMEATDLLQASKACHTCVNSQHVMHVQSSL